MDNAFDTMRAALDQARFANQAADQYAERMAQMLVGRLRHCGGDTLAKLKRELRAFNIHTKEWRR